MPSMVKKSNRKDLSKAHQEKTLYALQCLLWLQTSKPLKRNFNALYGFKPYKPLKNFNDLYV
jgi:hypothetical protein